MSVIIIIIIIIIVPVDERLADEINLEVVGSGGTEYDVESDGLEGKQRPETVARLNVDHIGNSDETEFLGNNDK